MQAMIRTAPPQAQQVLMSMLNTPLHRKQTVKRLYLTGCSGQRLCKNTKNGLRNEDFPHFSCRIRII
jgi:hypothetical protein